MRLIYLAPAIVLAAAGSSSSETFEDYERARIAVQNGEILPLVKILEMVEERFDGRMIEIELEIEQTGYFYELELVTRSGRLLEVTVDAKDGRTISVEDEEEDED